MRRKDEKLVDSQRLDAQLQVIFDRCDKRAEEGKKKLDKMGYWSRPKMSHKVVHCYDGDHTDVHRIVDIRK